MASSAPRTSYDAVIIGAGPNGLTAGVLLARAGLSVLVLEAAETPGGGCQSAELTLPGYVHDICSAIHPMAMLSPVFAEIGLEHHGVEWAWSDLPLAHPLPDGDVAVLRRSLGETAAGLGADGGAWERLLQPFAEERFIASLLQPIWSFAAQSLLQKARFGLLGLKSCEDLIRARFRGPQASALFAGCAAHSVMGLDRRGTASFGLMLALSAHVAGWPCARGGSQQITRALVRALEAQGGVLQTGTRITRIHDIPDARAILFDLNPRQVAAICADALPTRYREQLTRFAHGPGVFKLDWALDRPIPWRNRDCARAATVHVGGAFEEILRSESEVMAGRAPSHPFVLVAQPSLVDSSRSPAGKHTGWAYCHVPNGCTVDMTDRIEAALERFAPGFRDCIISRHRLGPAQLEAHNATMTGGDITGGRNDLRQILFRPVPRWDPYRTPNGRIFICSSSTPPGGGVHGMCGYHAARSALKNVFRLDLPRLTKQGAPNTAGQGSRRAP